MKPDNDNVALKVCRLIIALPLSAASTFAPKSSLAMNLSSDSRIGASYLLG
jgi:hypothetical protein